MNMGRTFTRRAILALPAAVLAGSSGLTLTRVLRADDLPPVDAAEMADGAAVFGRGEHRGTRVAGDGLLVADQANASFTSPVRELRTRITHIGVHWRMAPRDAPPPDAWLQYSVDGVTWSAWRQLPVETPPDGSPVGDYFAHLANTDGARFLRYRLVFPTGREGAVERVSATLIDASGPPLSAASLPLIETMTPTRTPTTPAPAPSPSPSVTTTRLPETVVIPGLTSDWPAPALGGASGYDVESGATLDVVSRPGWGADETLRFDANGDEIWREMFVPARLIAIHHTASRNSYGPGESVNDVRAIYHYHAIGHGWGDIGYNALIDKYGVIYEGRHGRGGDPGDPLPVRQVLSEGVSAGHALRHNYGSAGVGLIGNSMAQGWDMFEAAGPRWNALVAYCAFECRRGFIRPGQPDGSPFVRDFLRSDNIWRPNAPTVGGHIHYQETTCPGEPVIALLPALRRAIHERINGTSRTGVLLTSASPAALEVPLGTTIGASWAHEVPEPGWQLAGFEYRFEGWFKPEAHDDITYLAGYSAGSQPEAVWQSAPPSQRSADFRPAARGQYTLHVRAVVRQGDRFERAAYEAVRSWLIV